MINEGDGAGLCYVAVFNEDDLLVDCVGFKRGSDDDGCGPVYARVLSMAAVQTDSDLDYVPLRTTLEALYAFRRLALLHVDDVDLEADL